MRYENANSQIDTLRVQVLKLSGDIQASISREASPSNDYDANLKREYHRGRTEAEQKAAATILELQNEIQSLNASFKQSILEKDNAIQALDNKYTEIEQQQNLRIEEEKTQALLKSIQLAAEMISQLPEDQVFSAKDVLKLFKLTARKVMTADEASIKEKKDEENTDPVNDQNESSASI
jgi:hypothetical protein